MSDSAELYNQLNLPEPSYFDLPDVAEVLALRHALMEEIRHRVGWDPLRISLPVTALYTLPAARRLEETRQLNVPLGGQQRLALLARYLMRMHAVLSGPRTILDLGVGTGAKAASIIQGLLEEAHHPIEYLAVDISEELGHIALNRLQSFTPWVHARFVHTNFMQTPVDRALAHVVTTCPDQMLCLFLGGTAGNLGDDSALIATIRAIGRVFRDPRSLLVLGTFAPLPEGPQAGALERRDDETSEPAIAWDDPFIPILALLGVLGNDPTHFEETFHNGLRPAEHVTHREWYFMSQKPVLLLDNLGNPLCTPEGHRIPRLSLFNLGISRRFTLDHILALAGQAGLTVREFHEPEHAHDEWLYVLQKPMALQLPS